MNPIQFLILITFFNVFRLRFNNLINLLLLLILITSFLTEFFASILFYFKINLNILYSLSFIVHNVLWLMLLSNLVMNRKKSIIITLLYLSLCLCDFLLLKGKFTLNYNFFIYGSILYLILFIFSSIKNLKNENLFFFQSNEFILISSPIIFFVGLSLIFSFKSNSLNSIIIYKDFNLYELFIYFVNIIYYSLINLYIYRERKLND